MAQDLRALVQRARSGDRAAFGQLVRKYQRRVYATAFRMTGSHADADDVAQEALIRAYRGLSGFNLQSDFFTWLYRIVINVSLNHLRRSSRRRTLSVDDVTLPEQVEKTAGGDPGRQLELKQMTLDIGKALDELPDSLRATVVLVIFEGMPYKDAAEILECSEGTVAWRVHEARKKLRVPLARYLEKREDEGGKRASAKKRKPSSGGAAASESPKKPSDKRHAGSER